MAFTIRGIGTMNYGQREFRADGSYVTTLWFIFLYLPIVPIHSKRIRPTGEVKYYSMRPKMTCVGQEKTKPNRTQVIETYSWFAAEVAIFITATMQHSWGIAIPGVGLLLAPLILRKQAMDRVKAEALRAGMGLSPTLPE
jgi:hypothetical protein